MRNTPLPSAFAVSRSTENDIVTPETSSKPPSPLRQVETEPLFLFPSSKMAEADGTTVPLDLSDQEWPLLSYVDVLPTKVIPSPVEREPPDKTASKRSRKRSSRRSRRSRQNASTYSSTPTALLPNIFKSPPSPSNQLYSSVEPSNQESSPSSSTVLFSNVEPNILYMPPSPSNKNTQDVKPSVLQPPPSPTFTTITNVEPSDWKDPIPVSNTPPFSPHTKYHPLSTISSNFEQVSNFCWTSIVEASDYSHLQTSFRSIDDDLRNFLLNICEWEIADCCLLHDLGISTVRQIASLRPSAIENWPCINLCCQQDLGFINWWPRFFRRPSNEIYTLSTEKYYEDINVMTDIKRINHRQRTRLPRRATTSLPFRRPTRRPLRSHRNHHQFSTPYDTGSNHHHFNTTNDTGIINPIDNPTSSTVEAIIHEPNNSTNDDNHDTGPDEDTIRTLFENCAFIDSINIPPENPYESPPSSPPTSISPTNSIATIYEYDNAEDRHHHTSDEPYTSHTSISYNGNSYQNDRHHSEYSYHHSDGYPDHYSDHDHEPNYNDDDRHHAGIFDDDGEHIEDHYSEPEPYDY